MKSAQQYLPKQSFESFFFKYNTAIPSSAAIERFFPTGKDILKSKMSGLLDDHFQMLLFLIGNSEYKFFNNFVCSFFASSSVGKVATVRECLKTWVVFFNSLRTMWLKYNK